MYDVTIIIPTLNEAETIENTIQKVNDILITNHINGEILVVDDNSSMDNTIFILFDLKRKYPNLTVIIRQRDHGLSQSFVEGFGKASADIIITIDADGQHPVEKIPVLYRTILEGNDIAVASRYMRIEGSGVKDWAYHRRLLSWGATMLARLLFPKITDSGSGFFAFRKEVIKDAPLKPQGFRMLFEILGKGHWKTVKEIPYIFGVREEGVSKLTYKTVISYLNQLWGLLEYSLTHKDSHGYFEFKQITTFIGVGVTGLIVYTAILYLLTEWLGFWYLISSIIGTEISILSNFVLNDKFTFGHITNKKHAWINRILAYHFWTMGGIIISTSILVFLTEVWGVWYILSSIIGIFVAFAWNFNINRKYTWKEG